VRIFANGFFPKKEARSGKRAIEREKRRGILDFKQVWRRLI
jgi:hypothetical protein